MRIDSSSHRAALADLPASIGRSLDAGILSAFASDESGRVGQPPVALLKPKSLDDVRSIVRWASKAAVPLIPISSKCGPRRRGDTVTQRHAAVVDLSSMDRTVHVDGRDAIAVIEAGVTFAELDAALRPHGLRPFQPLQPRASKSVLAAFLEREPITVAAQHWDAGDPLAAMECVFGTGDVFHTGGAYLPGTLEENLARGNRQMFGAGPMHTDFGRVLQGAQGALGIVTWASLYCQRVPALEVPMFGVSQELGPVVELCYRLLRRRWNGQLFILNNVQLALLLGQSAAQFSELRNALPRWILYVELTASAHFPDEAIAYRRADLVRDAEAANVQLVQALAGQPASAVPTQQRARTDVTSHARCGLTAQEVFFLTQLDRVAAHLQGLSCTDVAPADTAVYLQPLAQGVNAHCQFTVLSSPVDAQALLQRSIRVADRCADTGGFFSRPYYPWAHVPFERDGSIRSLLASTKALFDPQGVLQPAAQSLGESA